MRDLKLFLLMFFSFGVPIGIWLGLEGYEIASAGFLIVGWTSLIIFLEEVRK